jgi:hypothetical protein
MKKWTEKETCIAEIKTLLENGYEVEIDSPDGFVPVSSFVNKGVWEKYTLTLEDGREVSVNENHLFETDKGWKLAKDIRHEQQIVGHTPIKYLCDDGWQSGTIIKSDYQIPIVDIQVEHENHRYYTNGISSHNTGVGKSLFMCHVAASCLSQGHNVLYITLEMAEEKIAERIDANLLNVDMVELQNMTREEYERKFDYLKTKLNGKLIIKEYPTASASSLHFRALLQELHLKKNFKPDIIFIDYLNICASSRIKPGANVNSYSYVKAIAEELRGLAVEFAIPVVSATQTTRSGFTNTDPGLEDTSECIFVDEKVKLLNGAEKRIGDVVPGDQILSQDEYKTVMFVHHQKPKECVEITLKSGKSITVSKDHVFPTKDGRKSINSGLKIGDILNSK